MISIEKLERSLKSLNMTLFVFKVLSIIWDALAAFVLYSIRFALSKGLYEEAGFNPQQLEFAKTLAHPAILISHIILLLVHILIVILLFRNHRAINKKEYISYLPYYLCVIPIVIAIVIQVLTAAFLWPVDLLYLVQIVILIFTFMKAKQLNENG